MSALHIDSLTRWSARANDLLYMYAYLQCALVLYYRGLPVFSVPGVSVTLPSHCGDVRFTPLFLSRELLDATVSSMQVGHEIVC